MIYLLYGGIFGFVVAIILIKIDSKKQHMINIKRVNDINKVPKSLLK